jgi:hypothetical protein
MVVKNLSASLGWPSESALSIKFTVLKLTRINNVFTQKGVSSAFNLPQAIKHVVFKLACIFAIIFVGHRSFPRSLVIF